MLPICLFSQVVNVEDKGSQTKMVGVVLLNFHLIIMILNRLIGSLITLHIFSGIIILSLLLLNEINLDRAGEVDFENDGFQHLRLSHHFNRIYSLETFTQNQFDPRKIKNRKLLGSRVRVHLSERNYLGLSSFYEIETLTDNIINKDIRLSSYF